MGEATDSVNVPENTAETVNTRSPSVPPPAPSATSAGEDAQAAQIRTRIAQTRGQMSETIDALHERLDPSRIKERVTEQIRDKATEAYDSAKVKIREATVGRAERLMANVSDSISDVTGRTGAVMRETGTSVKDYLSENPVPLALIGLGLGMLAFNTPSGRKSEYRSLYRNEPTGYGATEEKDWNTSEPSLTDRARDASRGMADSARSAAASVADTARSAADTAREQVRRVSDQTAETAAATRERLNTTLQDNPLALGIAALAAGAIVGLCMPASRVERQYMGEARDNLLDRAKSAARDTMDKVQHVAQEAGRTAKDAAQREGLTPEQSQAAGA